MKRRRRAPAAGVGNDAGKGGARRRQQAPASAGRRGSRVLCLSTRSGIAWWTRPRDRADRRRRSSRSWPPD